MHARLVPPLDNRPEGFFDTSVWQKNCKDSLAERSTLPHVENIVQNLGSWHDIFQWYLPVKPPRPIVYRGLVYGENALVESCAMDYFFFVNRPGVVHYTILFVSSHGFVIHIDAQYPHEDYGMSGAAVTYERKVNKYFKNLSDKINYTYIGPEDVYSFDVLPIQFIFNANCIEFDMCHLMAYLLLGDLLSLLERAPKRETVVSFFRETNTKSFVNKFFDATHSAIALLNDYLLPTRHRSRALKSTASSK